MKVTMRPARVLPKIMIHRKVAAYCRVSTQQEIQHHSLRVHRKGLVCICSQWVQLEVRLRQAVAGNARPRCI